MDLIIWRHAEAHEHPEPLQGRPGDPLDLVRRLTPRGEKQAARMAAWLDRQLPESTRVFASQAQRADQTVQALGRRYRYRDELLPGRHALPLLDLAQWPHARSPVLLVGHQPTLGQLMAHLLGLSAQECPVKKGAVWWLRYRERDGKPQAVVVTVQTPEML
ncbi:MAG: histidine phosphatase family protein [Hydrogenophaga sp.]|jgi:phosphohistidine phosphatase|nr:histidine phosphatase family protein [Hydrogenophaga sp.]